MRHAGAAISLTLSFVVSGCSGDGRSQTTGDCQAQVRADGIVYTSYGYTERRASRHSVADRAECHDAGEDAAGSVFPEEPEQVTTWTFSRYQPEKVLGVRVDSDTFGVFVADSVPDAERKSIYRDLHSD